MATVYISSTYEDLFEYRRAAYDTLRQLRHDSLAMEDYVAADRRPVDKCLSDVRASDIYVCIVAWRYGYVPDDDNPEKYSITELELRAAASAGIPRLAFLLSEDASWPVMATDMATGENGAGQRIRAFRDELRRTLLISEFVSTEGLAADLAVAVQETERHRMPERANRGTRPGEPLPDAARRIVRLPTAEWIDEGATWADVNGSAWLVNAAGRRWQRRKDRRMQREAQARLTQSVREAVQAELSADQPDRPATDEPTATR
ncbi:MAG: DUF4062 domain-containing protein [Solirubrobacteraceae bacterium]